MRKWTRSVGLFLGFLPALCFGQTMNAGPIPVVLDYASFRAQGEYSCLEMYVSLLRSDLTYRTADAEYRAVFELHAEFFVDDSLAKKQSWRCVDQVRSLEASQDRYLYHQVSVFLESGAYTLLLSVRDLESDRTGAYRESVSVPSYDASVLDISDIQFGLQVKPDRSRSRFSKNGYFILPNPHGLYSSEWPSVYYYAEIYNLSPIRDGLDSTYIVTRRLVDTGDEPIGEDAKKIRKRLGSALVEVDSIDVSGLIPGRYAVEIQVTDRGTGRSVIRSKPFIVYSPRRPAVASGDASGERTDDIYSMSVQDLDDLFDALQYITERDERRAYRKIEDLEGKRKFIDGFWVRRDPDSSTRSNEFKQEYLRRLRFANANFSSRSKEGWRTDRGRIYLVYGEPDQIDRYPSSLGQKPFQIWYYHHLEQGIEFVFVDISGFGELTLVHSTARKEIKDWEWKEKWLFQ